MASPIICSYCSKRIIAEEGFPSERETLQFSVVVCKGCAYKFLKSYGFKVKTLYTLSLSHVYNPHLTFVFYYTQHTPCQPPLTNKLEPAEVRERRKGGGSQKKVRMSWNFSTSHFFDIFMVHPTYIYLHRETHQHLHLDRPLQRDFT